ncbi:DNA-directed RNA polymerase subunit omega [Tissierella sp. Yu-01]|jgi:DNA-directed RNA polymerase subunit omega|uniref:DNA-directed RNA polymerase subunit omega n=1 Tax=Tissierella sp. Yu-01 TaxID=3035694 RepID=UPI00240D3E6F|nr:DNA-directed RNA polymerase subunit omega [Tissierella sp. Yu-01]WFA09819.1 DNA-directed RNA polymerase subunit omega [Tissierella sp. Yu-01]
MLNPSLKNLLIKGESKYTLVMVTSKRARQIIDGAKPMVETNSNKPVTIAIEELLEGKLEYESPNINSIK